MFRQADAAHVTVMSAFAIRQRYSRVCFIKPLAIEATVHLRVVPEQEPHFMRQVFEGI